MQEVFKPVVTAVDNWGNEIFAYFDHRYTNAVTKALNGVAKVINRTGRGYSFKVIRAKMLYSKSLQDQVLPHNAQAHYPQSKGFDVYELSELPIHPSYGSDLGRMASLLKREEIAEFGKHRSTPKPKRKHRQK